MLYELGDRVPELRGEGQFVAGNATVIGNVVLDEKSSIWFNVVIRGDNDLITVGPHTNIQDGSVLHTDAGIPSPLAVVLRWGTRPCCMAARLAITR